MRFLAAAVSVLCAFPLAASAIPFDYATPFSSYLAFGDSLTDDGKAPFLAPPSLDGRFSNGITYAEHIAADFMNQGKATANFAIGGATAEIDNEIVYPTAEATAIGTFAGQVAALDLAKTLSPLGAAIGSNPLVSVLFGANDIFQDLGEGAIIGDIGRGAANAVKAGIESIAALGSEFDDFVVINLPDLTLTPRFSGSPAGPLAQAETVAFNAQLATNIDMLRGDGLTIFEVDQDAFLRNIISNPTDFGFANVTEACTADITVLSFDNCSYTGTGVDFDLSLADSFLFADSVHPTGPAHAAFANEVRAALTPVPLPAGLPLLVIGMMAFGVLRQRRTA